MDIHSNDIHSHLDDEATLEAIRAVISDTSNAHQHQHHHPISIHNHSNQSNINAIEGTEAITTGGGEEGENGGNSVDVGDVGGVELTEEQQNILNQVNQGAQISEALRILNVFNSYTISVLEKSLLVGGGGGGGNVAAGANGANGAGGVGGLLNQLEELIGKLKGILDNSKKGEALLKALIAQLAGDENALANADPNLAHLYVLKQMEDPLKSINDEDTKSQPIKKSRKRKAKEMKVNEGTGLGLGGDEDGDGRSRKKRSIRLEHIIHKCANRRMGVEYLISNYTVPGTSYLPDPSETPPDASESLNLIQEYRPDFEKLPENDRNVREYLSYVTTDVVGELGVELMDMDVLKIEEGVNTYWLRLMKRWQEQLSRSRGELHPDEITRRKQNQYRRQQSLLARRTAAFDDSPLNACKSRSLFKTLLTIDFAAQTNERPDLSRLYSEEEWMAYRAQQLGNEAKLGHEVVDLFWLSPTCRNVLTLLDATGLYLTSQQKRKGKPKAPSPTFHLPSDLWDRSRSKLPLIRVKDDNGLPKSGAPGVIIFKFQVHPDIFETHPLWASGLYDNPPIPNKDKKLGSLEEVMKGDEWVELREMFKEMRMKANVKELNEEEVESINLGIENGTFTTANIGGIGNKGNTGNTGSGTSAVKEIEARHSSDQILMELNTLNGIENVEEGEGETAQDQLFLSNFETIDPTLRQPNFSSNLNASNSTPTPTLSSSNSNQKKSTSGIGVGIGNIGTGIGVNLNIPPPPPAPPAITSSSSTTSFNDNNIRTPGRSPSVGTGTNSGATAAGKVSGAITANGLLHASGPGSSLRARRISKKQMREIPFGAAEPVPYTYNNSNPNHIRFNNDDDDDDDNDINGDMGDKGYYEGVVGRGDGGDQGEGGEGGGGGEEGEGEEEEDVGLGEDLGYLDEL